MMREHRPFCKLSTGNTIAVCALTARPRACALRHGRKAVEVFARLAALLAAGTTKKETGTATSYALCVTIELSPNPAVTSPPLVGNLCLPYCRGEC